jgi:hypothetical protein
MNLEMEKCLKSNIVFFFKLKNRWIWIVKMDFHLPFFGECSVHLPYMSKLQQDAFAMIR